MSDLDQHPAWRRIRAELRSAVTESTWQLWLEPLRARRLEEARLVIEAPDEIRGWVGDRFGRLLHAAAASVLGDGARVDIVAAGEEPARPTRAPQPEFAAGDLFNPRFTFDQFVIGDANRLAHGAALAVAELPGLAYNPLFICGPPGLGKTHLLHSIGNYVATYGGGQVVRYTTAEAFTDHFVRALNARDIDSFKSAYRGVDVLLVDDVQFLQARAKTEQEFFHTFNALLAIGAQVVLTSDRLPRDLNALEDRLRERFQAGLVCDITPPDRTTRLAILRKRAHQDGLRRLAPGTLEVIADRVSTNVRALEGALIRVVAMASLRGREPNADLAAEVLDDLFPEPTRRHTVKEIQERTARVFGISVEQLVSPSRSASVAWPRQVAMYLARELTGQTLPVIGREFGNRNHTTVLHAWRRTQERMSSDPEAQAAVRRLTEELGGPADRSA